ncbi:PP2C family protein-serine/threonine phosphatase [Streptomyces olivochromogenes]|uniref:PP2C family protein-serine/threonine phosphatase n=1 Tax=Streptomyces olivochromogenes TaxID=1963 RepID=UPI001F175DA0|nr:SpoIIE family protein phosphatase [Streptomyces olivochromogenes]MCF3136563.1 SpoIIE family protein phosphatase [Streptomyces olivochromogenes]
MLGVARWIHSRRRPALSEAHGGQDGIPQGDGASSRLKALRTAIAGIGTTLDENTTCAELTRAAVRLVGGVAAVMRRTGEGLTGYEELAGDGDLLPDSRWATAVARDVGQPAADGWTEPWIERPITGRTRPAICLPLTTGELQFGVLVCAREGRPYDRSDAELLALLAERTASHIRHAREYGRISRTAGDLQRALLSEPGRPHPNLDVAIRYLPAGGGVLVGGDWCETVRLHFGRTLLVVGDVMGHGLEAAVDMSAYRSSLRYIASSDLPPHRVLRQMDEIASQESERRPATCLIVRVDPGRSQVTVASAGHLPPALIGQDGETSLLPVQVGPPLGTGFGGYESVTYGIQPDQTLVLFTDGLVEHRGEDIDRSLHRLSRLHFKPTATVDDTIDTILARLDAHNAEDDVAVLAARPRIRQGSAAAAAGQS